MERGKQTLVSPQELHPGRTQGDDSAGQALALHQRGRRGEFLGLHQAAGDARGGGARSRWDDDAETVVSTASHGTTASVHHETDQEAEKKSLLY